jgi:hypothetical protein
MNIPEKETQQSRTCGECESWSGSCSRGRVGRVAASEGCEDFLPRKRIDIMPEV